MVTYSDMSLADLKKEAKKLRVKKYYIMSKAQLLELLAMKEIPFKFRLEKMTISELRAIATERKMRGFWDLSKEELKNKLFPTGEDEQKNHGETSKHEDPQNEHPEKVGVHTSKDTFE